MAAKIRNVADVLKYIQGSQSFDRVINKVNFLSVGNGKCLGELKIENEHLNSLGYLHIGLTATMVDLISGYALMTKVSGFHVSTDINVRFMGRVSKGDHLLIEGYVTRIEKPIAFLGLEIRNQESGEVVVKGTHTRYMV